MKKEISFGPWLYRQRRSLDLTRQALADQVGCAEITLRRIENDTLKPSKELALILLEKLGIPEHDRQQWVQFARGLTGYPEQPLASSPTKPMTNLPSLLTTFIGRQKEQTEIIQHLNKYRLVTLTGSGGVGKTRLSLKIGGQVLEDYANGVWLVELASLGDPALLPQTVTRVFGITAQADIPLIEILINFLRAKTTLLILDNCEHLLDACAQLTDTLLKNCPSLKILATSREPLGITGEAVYRVPSLGLPHVEQVLEKFREFESVCLFEERAQLVQTDFSLTMENASFVAQICSRLDGIPLALELAAAKVSTFSAKQIVEQLEENTNLLTGGSRTALPRQQTIRASIEWSWNLLSDEERVLMRQLSVFAGGWTLESAQAIYDGDALGLTSSLVKKSLIVMNQARPEFDRREAGSETRYHFHEVVRQYAREKLVEAGEVEKIRNRHLKYFQGLSEQAESALRGPSQAEWFTRLEDELDNIRAALDWADKTDVSAGLYISGRLQDFWESFDMREGTRWLADFIEKPESKEVPHARAKALLAQGWLLMWSQHYAQVQPVAQECLALYRACGDQHGETDALLILGYSIQFVENMASAVGLYQQSLVLARSLGDARRQALALFWLGYSRHDDIQFVYWEKAIALFREVGDLNFLARALCVTARFCVLETGDIEMAQKYLDEAVLVNPLMSKNKRGHVWENVQYARSVIAFRRGDYEGAYAHLQEVAVITEESGDRMGYLWARAYLGYVALRADNLTEARTIFADTVQKFQKDGNTIGVIFPLEGQASLHVATGKLEQAARLIGWADAARARIIEPRPRLEQVDIDRDIAVILAKISNTAFEEAYDSGREMTLDKAVALALE